MRVSETQNGGKFLDVGRAVSGSSLRCWTIGIIFNTVRLACYY